MSVGLIALLDDIAGLAKVAAASIDDIASQAARAGAKTAGVIIDDAAVTPRYVVGFDPARELPIIKRIAIGSLRNKLLILLPVSLALGLLAPWAITPLLMLGGAYLCYEGTEKIYEAIAPHGAEKHDAHVATPQADPQALENAKIAGAIKTDFILSAEIMAITLASLPEGPFITKAIVLAVVAVAITAAVYGGVGLIVKADDVGLGLSRDTSLSGFGVIKRSVGRALVRGMPYFLKMLSIVGTAAMIWVGGGIIVHGLASYGAPQVEHAIEATARTAAAMLPAASGAIEWVVTAIGSGLVGLAIGALALPLAEHVIMPAWSGLRSVMPQRTS